MRLAKCLLCTSLKYWLELETTPQSSTVHTLAYGPLTRSIIAHIIPEIYDNDNNNNNYYYYYYYYKTSFYGKSGSLIVWWVPPLIKSSFEYFKICFQYLLHQNKLQKYSFLLLKHLPESFDEKDISKR